MATRDSELNIPLIEGMNAGDDERLNDGLQLLQNARLDEFETPRKRNGITQKGAALAGAQGNFIGAIKDQLVVSNGRSLFSYSESLDSFRRALNPNFDIIAPCFGIYDGLSYSSMGVIAPLVAGERSHFRPSSAENDDYIITAAHDGAGNPFVIVRDKATGSYLLESDFGVGSPLNKPIKVLSFNGKIAYIVNSGDISLGIANDSGPSITFDITTLAVATRAQSPFDVCPFGDGFALIFHIDTTTIGVRTFDGDGVEIDSTTITDLATIGFACSIAHDSAGERIVVGHWTYDGADAAIRFTSMPEDLSSQTTINILAYSTGAVFLPSIGIVVDGASCHYFFTFVDSGNISSLTLYARVNLPTTAVDIAFTSAGNHFAMATKPIIIDGSIYVAGVLGPAMYQANSTVDPSTTQRVGLFCRFTALGLVPVARYGYGTHHDDLTASNLIHPLQDIIYDGEFYKFIYPKRISHDTSIPVKWVTEAKTVKLKYLDLETSQPINYNGSLVFPGALPMVFDGSILFEYGMHHGPIITSFQLSAGAGNIPDGTYLYIATYEYVDAQGITHISPPSPVLTAIVTGGPKNISLLPSTLKMGVLATLCKLRLYRTEKDSSAPFYMVTQEDGLYNNPSSETSTYVDNRTDAQLLKGELYPFNGDVIEPDPPPSSNAFWTYKNRLFCAPFDEPQTVAYSQESTVVGSARLQSGFSDFFKTSSDDTNSQVGDRTVTGAVLDDKMLIFKESSTLVMAGDGPDRSGGGEFFSRPVLISSSVGTLSPRSAISCQLGVIFKSRKGIYLIGRGLDVVFIGEPVDNYSSLQVTGAIDDPNGHYVVFTTKTAEALIFDYRNMKWSVYSNYAAHGATFWRGKLAHLKPAGTVFVENSEFSDAGAFVPMKIILNWIKLAGIQGYVRIKRVMIFGKYKSAHNLRLSLAHDYELYNTQTETHEPQNVSDFNRVSAPSNADLYAGANNGVYQVEFHVARQKSQALKLTIEDIETSTKGESFELTGISMIVGKKKGIGKISEKKKG